MLENWQNIQARKPDSLVLKQLAHLSPVVSGVLPQVALCWHQGSFDSGGELNHEKTFYLKKKEKKKKKEYSVGVAPLNLQGNCLFYQSKADLSSLSLKAGWSRKREEGISSPCLVAVTAQEISFLL